MEFVQNQAIKPFNCGERVDLQVELQFGGLELGASSLVRIDLDEIAVDLEDSVVDFEGDERAGFRYDCGESE